MTPKNKGIVSIVAGVLSLVNLNIYVFIIGSLAPSFFTSLGDGFVVIVFSISLFCSIMAIFLGIEARKGDAKILGLVGLVLGIIGTIVLSTQILVAAALWGVH